jgi:hypothetical protein
VPTPSLSSRGMGGRMSHWRSRRNPPHPQGCFSFFGARMPSAAVSRSHI